MKCAILRVGERKSMLKIVVFDGGWGGEMVADYLEEELGVVEVVRVIDWKNVPYDNKNTEEVFRIVEDNLRVYIGKVDVIVLAGYAVSLVADRMRRCYPEQKFVAMGVNYDLILRARTYPDKVVVFAGANVNAELAQEIRRNLMYSTLILPDTGGWEELVNEDLMTLEIIKAELAWDFAMRKKRERKGSKRINTGDNDNNGDGTVEVGKTDAHDKVGLEAGREAALTVGGDGKIRPDVILLLNTHYFAMKADLEEIFGWQVRILDFRQKLLHDVCAALKLRGVDGRRAK